MRKLSSLFLMLLALGCRENAAVTPGGTGGAAGGAGSGGAVGTGGAGPIVDSCAAVPPEALVTAWTADPHFCLIRFADNVPRARGLAFAPNGDLFVAGAGRVAVLFDADGNGVSDASERATYASASGLNHGVLVDEKYVYASSQTTVYRWSYMPGQRTAPLPPETVVHDIEGGGHSTRTLLLDAQRRLYVSIGSASNVDAPAAPDTPPATRALIRRYDMTTLPAGGYSAASGELFAAGLRNEAGLGLDRQGRIWGVENGRDDLRADGDPDMYNDNPAEEVNVFDPARPGRNYGYPFCWSEGVWAGPRALGPGTQHLDPDVPGGFSEGRCQDATLVVPPAFALRAHLAPLDIVEYTGDAYPPPFRGNLFVASHGSWNRAPSRGHVGRLIIRLPMGAAGMPTSAENFLGEKGPNGLREGEWSIRPVSIRVDAKGLLTFSDDASGTINKIGYRP